MGEKNKYLLLLVLCVLLSGAGIAFSVYVSKEAIDGSRGGILAVGFAIVYLVVKKDIAGQVFDALQEDADKGAPKDVRGQLDNLTRKFEDLQNLLRNKGKDEEGLNSYLVVATIIGTLAAAFGDVMAKWLIAHR